MSQRNGFVDDPARQCVGKLKFDTKVRAKRHLKRAREFKGRGLICVYLCPHCTFWHLGHKPGSKKKKAAERAETRYTSSNEALPLGGGEDEIGA